MPLYSLYKLNKLLLVNMMEKKIVYSLNATPQTEELGNKVGELKRLIDDSESVISINLDRWARTHKPSEFVC